MCDNIVMDVYAARYANVDDAKTDYQLVKDLYAVMDLMDTFDAVVLCKNDEGKVKIVKKHEQPTWTGAGVGLSAGVLCGLFPAAFLGTGVLATMAGVGGIMGALTGHAVGGLNRSDLKDLGELLDEGEAGLLVITATDVSARVEAAITTAQKVVKKEIKADKKALKKELKELEKQG